MAFCCRYLYNFYGIDDSPDGIRQLCVNKENFKCLYNTIIPQINHMISAHWNQLIDLTERHTQNHPGIKTH